MAIELLPDVVQLRDGETLSLFVLESRAGPLTQQKRMSILGESILSSVFIKACDAGATLDVKYFDTTTGTNPEDGERFDLNSHAQFTSADVGVTNRILVARIHNKPICEITVAGGSVEFGVYVSVRSETATDANLPKEGDAVDFDDDGGQPVMCVDENNEYKFLRCDENGLIVSVTGTVDLPATKERLYGTALVADTVTATLITHMPTAAKKLIQVLVGGDGYGEFAVKINGTLWATLRNSWNDRTVIFRFDSKALSTSDTITVEATNVSIGGGGGSCNYEAFVYLGDG